MYRGRITEILQRTQNRFVGTLAKQHNEWVVLPDGNTLTAADPLPRRRHPAHQAGDEGGGRADAVPRGGPAGPRRHHRGARQGRREGRRPQVCHRPVQPARRVPGRGQGAGPPGARPLRPRRRAGATARHHRPGDLHDRPRRRQGLRRRHQPAAAGQRAVGTRRPHRRRLPLRTRRLARWTRRPQARQQLLLPRPRHPDAAGNPLQRRLLAPGGRAAAVQERVHHLRRRRPPVGTKFANTVIKSASACATARPRRSSTRHLRRGTTSRGPPKPVVPLQAPGSSTTPRPSSPTPTATAASPTTRRTSSSCCTT